jgi:hypothetical protein
VLLCILLFLMKSSFITCGLLLLLLPLAKTFGQSDAPLQESRYKPFSILIISPDTAQIDESLSIFIDSIEFAFSKTYHKLLSDLELKRKQGDDKQKGETDLRMTKAKSFAMEVYNFQYYKMISIGTFVSLSEDFQKYPWEKERCLDIVMEDRSNLYNQDLKHLASFFEMDYIIYFDKIQIEKSGGGFIISMTTHLYSTSHSKTILDKEITATSDKLLCRVYGQNPLICLLTRITDSSTSEIFHILKARQAR